MPYNPAETRDEMHPEWHQAVLAYEKLQSQGFEAVIVGGAVRDLLLGLEPKDNDLATNAKPEQIEKLFEKSKTPDTSQAYVVTRVIMNGVELEIATYRKDVDAHLGRQATQVYTDNVSLEDDLERRDFTINNMALDPVTHQLLYVGESLSDLDNKLIRFVGDPSERIQEDPLRILRAVRFKNRFGFSYEPSTHRALKDAVKEGAIGDISGERMRAELTAIFKTALSRREALEDLDELGILDFYIPELTAGKDVEQGSKFHAEGDVWTHQLLIMEALPPDASEELLWATLLHDIGKPHTQEATEDPNYFKFYGHAQTSAELARPILNKLKFSNAQKENILWLIDHHIDIKQLPEMRPANQKKMMNHPAFGDLVRLHEADGMASHSTLPDGSTGHKKPAFDAIVELWQKHQSEPAEVQKPSIVRDLGIDGRVIMGLIPNFTKADGKLIGIVKNHLEEMFANGELTIDDRDKAIEIAKQIIAQER